MHRARNAIGYVVPTPENREPHQRGAMRAWAHAHRIRVIEWHVESDYRAPLTRRSALSGALAAVGSGKAKNLLIASPELVATDPTWRAIVERLAAHFGATIMYVDDDRTGNGAAEAFGTVLAAYEQMLIELRMRTAAELRKPRGAFWGRCPWGYRLSADGMRLEPYEPEQNVIAVVRHARANGFKLREIADQLREAGIVGRTGKPLSITRIFELLDASGGTERGPRMAKNRAR